MSIKPPFNVWTVNCDYCKSNRNRGTLYFRQKREPSVKQIEKNGWLCFPIMEVHMHCCDQCKNGRPNERY